MGRLLCLAILLSLAITTICHGQVDLRYATIAPVNGLTTQLDNRANNSYSPVGPVINNLQGGGQLDGALFCDIEGHFVFAATPTTGTAIAVWLLRAPDGTNYETAWTSNGSVGPGRAADLTLPVSKGQTDTRVTRTIPCPAGLFKVQALNDGTGQAMASSGNTILIRAVTIRGE